MRDDIPVMLLDEATVLSPSDAEALLARAAEHGLRADVHRRDAPVDTLGFAGAVATPAGAVRRRRWPTAPAST